ncbi:TIGR01620 family protein [[Haemophilus] felis]|uniref:UPF0283 membrane protein B0188_07015 n=1 Tax=[Haemophilus] felis TaxID=123822 RepID=A0A1T0AYT3_9PAST|nr:TIGR01620 family protein [[Haemophilus] felis]OOS02962.1 TIGR01620 family protein [[Haemophilus] felis]
MKEKQFFEGETTQNEEQKLQPKRVFSAQEIEDIEVDLAATKTEEAPALEPVLQPKLSWFKKGIVLALGLFLCACVAQTVHWLIQSWQQNQWIALSFALAACVFVLVGAVALCKELIYLRKLKNRQDLQQHSQLFLSAKTTGFDVAGSALHQQEAKDFCQKVAQIMKLSEDDPNYQQWKQRLDSGYSAQEITYLFSQYVLQSRDKQAQKLISQHAAQAAVVIAVSPLALVDMLFLAWRNIRLLNQIAHIYQVELGYWSRLRLFRMVLINLAFAGASEVVQEMSFDWLSQDLTAKLSARVAQGMGAGLLTARLGLRAMEFCRPIVFSADEKPRLSHIQQHLLSSLKQTILQSLKKKVPDLSGVK